MVLSVSRPWKHPTTGVYYYRRAVPEDLRAVIGRREEKRSLGTKDPATAKAAHATVAAEIEAKWAGMRQGVQAITNKQAHAIAGEFYRTLVAAWTDDPLPSHDDDAETNGLLGREGLAAFAALRPYEEQKAMASTMAANDDDIHAFLSGRGILVDRDGFERIRKAVGSALAQGHQTLARHAQGDYRDDPDADRFPPVAAIEPVKLEAPAPGLTSKELFDEYQSEAKTAPSTEKKWRAIFAALVKFVGHDDMRRITEDDVLRWKNALLADGASNRHVRNSHLACLKAVFNYGVANKRVSANPASGITVKATKKVRTRQKGFTEAEAITILRATMTEPPPRTTSEYAGARRWVPWLCCYSGARVNELTQLRASDIVQVESGGEKIWIMRISPEAGSVKNGSYRDVAIHPHLIEQGFLGYVANRKGRHLFYEPARHRGGSGGNPQYKKVGERLAAWVRDIGVDDPAVQPNHGWRHRFNSVCRDVRIDADVRDLITGHVPRTVGEEYGDLWAHVMAREIARLPRYKV
ncbi:DUF6538 domain-containing protein [Pelagibacterium lacus]|uniref:Integrase n=1 Tax=Pelagibacterium lacus TaxID=2282655 RepID=A0A369W771_9HYPH|nr:DUF6538 domain-containing protein [Pelagibacterium lacus]RDE09887.1 integrase [Pelagibacterium lacus]